MTRALFIAALADLAATPPRHPIIDGEQITSIAELEDLARRQDLNMTISTYSEALEDEGGDATLHDATKLLADSVEELRLVRDRIDQLLDEIRIPDDRIIAHIDRLFDEFRTMSAATAYAVPVAPPHQPSAPQVATVVPEVREPTIPPIVAKDPPQGAPAADQLSAPQVATGGGSDKPLIPENLGTLSYNALRSLAKDLGISPAPNTQQGLLDAIEQVRAAGAD
jgi:hypothetical protein